MSARNNWKDLEALADDLSVHLDDASDEEMARFDAMPPAEKIRYVYMCGECDAIAVTLHRIKGWPIRGVIAPEHGMMHRVVEAPDGRLLDASGWTDIAELAHRYGTAVALGPAGGEEQATGFIEQDYDGFDDSIAGAVYAIRNLPWPPFNEKEFAAAAAKPLEGVDFPYPEAISP
jgi:hypothetical protein